MSGTIRQLIGPAKARLSVTIDTIKGLMEPDVVDQEDPKKLSLQIGTQIRKCNIHLDNLQKYMSNWQELILETEDDTAKQAEEGLFKQQVVDDGGLQGTIMDAMEQLAETESLLEELRGKIEHLDQTKQTEQSSSQEASAHPTSKLQPLPLIRFSGLDPPEFPSFLDNFMAEMDAHHLESSTRYHYF